MDTISFLDDYSEGAHPELLKRLLETNLTQQKAYGYDGYSELAKDCLRKQIGNSDIPVYFVAGGTLANLISVGSCLRPHEAVIAATTGHIVVRETGAIEAIGHKIINVKPSNGKLTPEGIQDALDNNAHFPHMAKPRLVYISNATELGTLYTLSELKAISEICRKRNLLLLLDGARLGVALAADGNDVTLADVASLTDIFWIGGTKVGMLLGEAIVIPNVTVAEDFAFQMKQRGALLSKGRVLGVQFLEAFRSNLFFDLAKHTNTMAQRLSSGIQEAGYDLGAQTETNQVFAILPNSLITVLEIDFHFYRWERLDGDRTMIRLVTSWATTEEQVSAFIRKLQVRGC